MTTLLSPPTPTYGALRDYQADMVTAVRRALGAGHRRMYCSLPTGCGKTRIAAELVASAYEGNRRVLWLVHRRELVTQAAEAIRARLDDADGSRGTVGIVMADDDEPDAPVVVASIQTLRGDRLSEDIIRIGRIIIDECHHVTVGSQYERVINALEDDEAVVIGITATPFRADRKAMQSVLHHCAYERDIPSMIDAGWLCNLRHKSIPISGLDLSQVRMSRKLGEVDFSERDLAPAVEQEYVVNETVERTAEYIGQRATIVFSASVMHAHRLAAAYRANGLSAAAIWGDMPTADRSKTLQNWRDGVIQIVTNCAVLTEGFDYPAIGAVVIARPTMSVGLYTQMVGRGTRLYDGKIDCIVLDITGRMPGRAVTIDLSELVGEDLEETADGTARVVKRSEAQRSMRPHKLRDPYGRSRWAWTEHPYHDAVWFAPVATGLDAILLPEPVSGLYRPWLVRRTQAFDAKATLYSAAPEASPRRQAIANLELTLANAHVKWQSAGAQWRALEPSKKQLKYLNSFDAKLAAEAQEQYWSRGDVNLAIEACILQPVIGKLLLQQSGTAT